MLVKIKNCPYPHGRGQLKYYNESLLNIEYIYISFEQYKGSNNIWIAQAL